MLSGIHKCPEIQAMAVINILCTYISINRKYPILPLHMLVETSRFQFSISVPGAKPFYPFHNCYLDTRKERPSQPGLVQFWISISALLHMLCEIESSASKRSLPLKGCMSPACKCCSDLIKLDFIIGVVKLVWFLWANNDWQEHLSVLTTSCQQNPSASDIGISFHSPFSCFFLYLTSDFYALFPLFALIDS